MLILLSIITLDLLVLNGLVLWAFMHFAPERNCRAFNVASFLLAPVVSTVFAFWVNVRLAGDAARDWLPALTALAWVAAFPAILMLAGLVRNYVIYHPPRAQR